jgi:hypothetical protein
MDRGPSILLLFGALAWGFFQPQVVGKSACLSNTTPKKAGVPTGLVGLSVLLKMKVFKFLLQIVDKRCGATSSAVRWFVACAPHEIFN